MVWFCREVEGQSLLMARGPSAAIAAIRASLEAALPNQPEEGDERSREAREFDLLQDLLTGGATAGVARRDHRAVQHRRRRGSGARRDPWPGTGAAIDRA
jgi:hypothetical protein